MWPVWVIRASKSSGLHRNCLIIAKLTELHRSGPTGSMASLSRPESTGQQGDKQPKTLGFIPIFSMHFGIGPM